MTKFKLLGATALVLSSIVAIPAAQAAQDTKQDVRPAHRLSQSSSHANRAMKMSKVDNRGRNYQRRQLSSNRNPAYANGYDNRRDTGFWPADAAANVVDGAVDTAGAIATAPFRNDSYARYDNGYNSGWNNNGWNNGYGSNAAYYDNGYNNGWDRRDPRYRSGDVAANVVGGAVDTAGALAVGAVDTAGAIATAPFRGDAYASYNNNYNPGWNNNGAFYNQSYAERNGFVCQPGSWFRGQDGRRHICQ